MTTENYPIEVLINNYPWNIAAAVLGVDINDHATWDILFRVYVPGLYDAMDMLDFRKKTILDLRFREKLTLEETGRRFGVTRERVRQLEANSLYMLKYPDIKKKYLLVPKCEELNIPDVIEKANEIISAAEKIKRIIPVPSDVISEQTKETPLEDTGLSIRTVNALRRKGVRTVEDFMQSDIDRECLQKTRMIGVRTIAEIEEKLMPYGVSL
ncbi:MAG: hypothetical protein IJI14_17870 [Anaerolineaceae bacterium]|nr:hypothetical protein [Anaerolineaceae bacterium]